MTVMVPTTHVKWELELFLLGFGQNKVSFIEPEKREESFKLKYWKKENLFSAYNWLEKLAAERPENIPNAMLLDADLFKDDNNKLFIKSLKKHPELKNIPLIAISTGNYPVIDNDKLMSIGIDDHYVGEIDSEMLESRIDFLNKFKQDYEPHIENVDDSLEYKIPLPKRIFDIAVSSTLILLLSPVLLTIALLIKLGSKGDVIYKSERIGTGYEKFYFLKFRSMRPGADKEVEKLKHLNKYNTNGGDKRSETDSVFVKLENDPRITSVGRIIRKTSLDELPQLFNVLRGEMSIVGNRPLPLKEADALTKDQWAKRFLAPAGITGLWQVSPDGKDTMSVEQRIGLDIEYANNFTFFRDLEILAKTPLAMIQKGE